MSQSASRVIGIIRISEPSTLGVNLKLGVDDSTLGALLASLVGKCSPRQPLPPDRRWAQPRPLSCRGTQRVVPANLLAIREQLEREYLELGAG